MFNLVIVCVTSLLGYIFNADLPFFFSSTFSVGWFFWWVDFFGGGGGLDIFFFGCLFALSKEIACRIVDSPC